MYFVKWRNEWFHAGAPACQKAGQQPAAVFGVGWKIDCTLLYLTTLLALPKFLKISEWLFPGLPTLVHAAGGGATLLLPKPMCGPQGRRSGGRYTDVNHDHSALNRQVWEGDSFKLWIFNDFLQTVRGLTELSEHGRWRWRRLPPRFWNLTFSCYISSKKTFFFLVTTGKNEIPALLATIWKNPLLFPPGKIRYCCPPAWKNPLLFPPGKILPTLIHLHAVNTNGYTGRHHNVVGQATHNR